MMLQDFFAQVAAVHMHVDFRGADVLVAQHGLNGTQVGPSLWVAKL